MPAEPQALPATKLPRLDLLRALEAVAPGLTPRESVAQSNCFCFKGGYVMTYNEYVACRAKSGLPKSFTGAVPHKSLLAILNKLQAETVTVLERGGELVVRGARSGSSFRYEPEITLPVDEVEWPGKSDWKPLPPDFGEAVAVVQECAKNKKRDESEPDLCCVHVHPDWVEATDRDQMARYTFADPLPVAGPVLVPKENLRHVCGMDTAMIAETENWVHFRGASGVVLGCRRFGSEFPDLSDLIPMPKARKATLPTGLAEAVDRAAVFSSEIGENDHVLVSLGGGKFKVKGIGVTGKHWEKLSAKYDGKPVAFLIHPALLTEIAKRHTVVTVGDDKLKVDGGKWVYITSTGSPAEMEKAQEEGGKDAEAE